MSSAHSLDAAKWVAALLHRHGYEAYIIGGAVRDMYLGHSPKDFDIATNATPEQLEHVPEFDRSIHHDTAQAYGVTRVRFMHRDQRVDMEVATFRKDLDAHRGRKATHVMYANLEDDVARRDLTINALAYDPQTDQVIDFVDGLNDLDSQVIRFIGDPATRIQEDPLRVLRAIRFKNRLDFSYAPATVTAIRRTVRKEVIAEIAIDRLREEMTLMLLHASRRQALEDLMGFGILARVLPEVTAGRGVAQPSEFHAEGDVYRHELLTMDYLPPHPSHRLVWAALLHDIGKVPTFTPAAPGDRIRFDRHYAVGAEMAKTIMRRLRFSNRNTRDVYWMIYHHLSIDDVVHMRPSHQQKILGHPAFGDLLELHRADAAASWRPDGEHVRPQFEDIEALWHTYQQKSPHEQQPSLKRDVGIDGHWLIRKFGSTHALTGPVIKQLLENLDEWYRDERITDETAYERRVQSLLDERQES